MSGCNALVFAILLGGHVVVDRINHLDDDAPSGGRYIWPSHRNRSSRCFYRSSIDVDVDRRRGRTHVPGSNDRDCETSDDAVACTSVSAIVSDDAGANRQALIVPLERALSNRRQLWLDASRLHGDES